MGEAGAVQRGIKRNDVFVDPRFRPRIGAGAYDTFKIGIIRHAVGLGAHGFAQAARHMQAFDGKNAAARRVVPVNFVRVSPFRHGEDTHGIGLQNKVRR
ncbi:MAG: hypothetical protein PW788_10910 [Micavibrio sp.]|nr:hypothetical protein [Micavibrio sp.]